MAKKKHSQIPEFEIFDSQELKDAWVNKWIVYRAQKNKKPYVPLSLKSALTELRNLAQGDQSVMIAIIDQTVSNNWDGFFPLKNKNGNQSISNRAQSGQDELIGSIRQGLANLAAGGTGDFGPA